MLFQLFIISLHCQLISKRIFNLQYRRGRNYAHANETLSKSKTENMFSNCFHYSMQSNDIIFQIAKAIENLPIVYTCFNLTVKFVCKKILTIFRYL